MRVFNSHLFIDGPSFISKAKHLRAGNGTYVCSSSFQFLIPALTELLGNGTQSYKLPGSHCNGTTTTTFCIFEFTGINEIYVNLTLSFVNYEGFTTTDHSYGGIAIFDGTKHILDVYSNYGTNRSVRNIYSTQYVMKISVYTYPECSSITSEF